MAGTVQLPKCADGFLGPQAKFQAYGLATVSHSECVVYMQEDQPETEIVMAVPQDGTKITIKLLMYGQQKDFTGYTLIRAIGDKYLFLIRPPMPGFYKFQIYARPPTEASSQMLGVYNYLVHCPGSHGDNPFPKQYPPWKNGCYLWEPISLPKGLRDPQVKYKVLIPNAKDVQVKVDQQWNPLEETEPGVFEGIVNFSQGYAAGSKAKVNAQFPGSNNMLTLMEYSL